MNKYRDAIIKETCNDSFDTINAMKPYLDSKTGITKKIKLHYSRRYLLNDILIINGTKYKNQYKKAFK